MNHNLFKKKIVFINHIFAFCQLTIFINDFTNAVHVPVVVILSWKREREKKVTQIKNEDINLLRSLFLFSSFFTSTGKKYIQSTACRKIFYITRKAAFFHVSRFMLPQDEEESKDLVSWIMSLYTSLKIH